MKRKWMLFAYPVMDIKAAEAMLNRRAGEGWRLEKLWLNLLARFVPAEKPVRYSLDWYDPAREDGPDYLRLLADAGWYQAAQTGYWNIYEAPAGTPPIQTDGDLEYRRFRKKSLRRMMLGWGICGICFLLLALLSLLPGRPAWQYWLDFLTGYNTAALAFACLPLLLAGGLLWTGRLLLRLVQWRRAAAAGLPFPTPGAKSALAARLLMALGYLLIPLFLLALLLDVSSGAYSRAWMVGIVIGALLYGLLKQDPAYRRARRGNWIMAGGAAVLLVVSLLPLSTLTARFQVAPPLAGQQLLPTAEFAFREDSTTFLAAHTEWTEWWSPEGANYTLELDSQGWVLPWDWLADGVQNALTEQTMAPLPGYDGVWADEDGYVIRRGNTILWVEIGPPASQWLDQVLARLGP